MIFDLTKLKSKIENEVMIDMTYEFSKEQLSGTEVLSPFTVSLEGTITRDVLDGFLLSVRVKGQLFLPCSVTLKPVPIPLDINIIGSLDELLEEIDENHKKIENSIDILPIIWENILMEIPMKVTSPDAYFETKEGDGWKFVTAGEENNNPALEKLKDLL